MKLKKALALFLSLLMLVSLISCGEEKKEAEKSEETEENITTEALSEKDKAYLKAYAAEYRGGKFDEQKKFQYEDLSVYFDVAPYKGLNYPDDPVLQSEVTDEYVEDYLTQIFLAAEVSDDEYTLITEGEIQKFDMVTLDYKGVIDGKAVDDATAENQSLLIGSGKLIPGFEEGLIGKRIGEEVVLNLKFSPYYAKKDVAGKDVDFYVTVKELQRPAIPEFDVKVINENYGTAFKTVDEARDWLKRALSEEKKNSAYAYLSTYFQDTLLEQSTVKSYPEKEMENYRNHYADYYSQYKGEEDWETFCQEQLNITYNEFKEQAEEYAKESVAANLLIRSIAKEEKITYTDEQLIALIEGIYKEQGAGYYDSVEKMVTEYMGIYGADYFEHQLITAHVLELIHENAVKEEV